MLQLLLYIYRKNNLQIELSNRVCQEKQKLFLQDHAIAIKTIIINTQISSKYIYQIKYKLKINLKLCYLACAVLRRGQRMEVKRVFMSALVGGCILMVSIIVVTFVIHTPGLLHIFENQGGILCTSVFTVCKNSWKLAKSAQIFVIQKEQVVPLI